MSSLRLFVFVALLLLASTIGGTEYLVGPGKPYANLHALPMLAPGDVVSISSGTYNEVMRWRSGGTAANPILIRGMGAAPVFDANGLTVDGSSPNPRAVFQIEASYITVENIQFINARNGNNGAGVRITGSGITNTTLKNCKITYCDMGVMSDGNDKLLIDACEIAYNGTVLFDGYSHNLYLNGQGTTVQYSYIHDALYGQNFKTRGHYTELLYNYIADAQDGDVCLENSALTTTANSNAVMTGNVVVSKPRESGYNSQRFVQFGQDSGGAHTGTLYASNNTFVAGDSRIRFFDCNASGATVIAKNNIFYNSPNLAMGVSSVTGSNNWTPTGSSMTAPGGFTGSTSGSNPGFVNAGARDFHLTSTSQCINIGTSVSYVDGNGASFVATPTQEYVHPLGHTARVSSGALDAGAYEFASAPPPPTTYTLNVTNGSGTGSYTANTNVTITANAAPAGQTFDKWVVNSGTPSIADANAVSTTLIMPANNASVTATYKAILYALTVTNGTGSGSYAYGANVTITANAAPAGQVFDKWVVNSGTPSIANTSSASTTLTTTASNASVTATYKTILYTLTVTNGTGSGSYASGASVTITANAAPAGQVFDKWVVNSGSPSIADTSAASTTLTTTASNASVTATYRVVTYALTVTNGTGSGNYASGASVTITANAAPAGQVFDKWVVNSGTPSIANTSSTSTTLTTTASDASVSATYRVVTYALTVTNGTGTGNYASGVNVMITANAAPAGQVFDKWVINSGTPSIANTSSASTTLTMSASAASVSATYKAAPPTLYALTVTNGSGSGNYASGAGVTITANAAPAGQVFDKWVINSGTPSIANASAASTTLTMPASAASVSATFKTAPTTLYALTVTNGSGAGSYAANASVMITANAAPAGQVFDKWVVNAGTPTLVNLNAISTTLTMAAGNASVTATYKAAPVDNGSGLKAEYFANQTLGGAPALTRTEEAVYFDWGTGAPAAQIPVDHFSARWSGQIQPQYSETYTFITRSDDGVRLWINGVLVINNWTDHSPTDNTGMITLNGGQRYSIMMEFYENGGGAVAQLRWLSTNTPRGIVPTRFLYPDTATLPAPWKSVDVGQVGIAGSASATNGLFTVRGSGAGILGTSDEFEFTYRTMSGDGQLVARVASLEANNANAKFGVMMRSSLEVNAPFIMACEMPGGATSIRRNSSSAGISMLSKRTNVLAPVWLRVTRTGNTFSTTYSLNGQTWTQLEQVNLALGSTIYVGLVVTSQDDAIRATATFDNVK